MSSVVVIDVGIGNALEGLADGFLALTNEDVKVIAHEAVGVVGAALGNGRFVIVVDESHAEEAVKKEPVVLFVLEDDLVVDTTHHDMVDASGGGVSGATGHGC